MSYFTIRNKAKFTISYIDDIEYCITNGQFTKHLSRNDIGLDEYVKKYILNNVDITCPICNIRNKKIDKPTWNFFDYCKTRECGSIVLSNKIKSDPEIYEKYKKNVTKIFADKDSDIFKKWKISNRNANMKKDENGLSRI